MAYNANDYYVDFTDRSNLTDGEKIALEKIQTEYYPLQRVTFLAPYRNNDKITDDDYETMTSIPYSIR